MKTKVKIKENKENDLEFPLLAKNKRFGGVVLFTDYSEGTVISENEGYDIGHVSVYWLRVDDKTQWKILPMGSKVTLIQ